MTTKTPTTTTTEYSVEATGLSTADALCESDGHLRLFIELAPAAIAMLDSGMRYLAVSRRWREDYGLGDRPLLGCSHYEVFPEIPERWKVLHRRALAGEVLSEDEDRFERADGSVQYLRWQLRPWRHEDRTIGGLVVYSEDVTERTLTRRANDALALAAASAEAANRAKSAFLAAMSHELRTPLNAIIGFSSLMLDGLAGSLNDEQRKQLLIVRDSGQQLLGLVDSLLAVAREGEPRAVTDARSTAGAATDAHVPVRVD